MSFQLLNGVRDAQAALQETGLYAGAIDGVWGPGCNRAASALFNYQAQANNVSGLTTIPAFIANAQVILGLQTNLKKLSQYSGNLDGIWGDGCRAGLKAVKQDYIAKNNLPKFSRCWSKKVTAAFIAKIEDWVKRNNMPDDCVDYLMAIMAFESGGTFSPSKQNNAGAHYFGLIQFGTAAATDLGTTVEALIKMTAIDQLDYVFKYFEMRMRSKPLRHLEDFYMSVFYPAAIGKSADTTIFQKGSVGYRQNAGLDVDKDGNITVGEISTRIYQSYYNGLLTANRSIMQ